MAERIRSASAAIRISSEVLMSAQSASVLRIAASVRLNSEPSFPLLPNTNGCSMQSRGVGLIHS